MVQKNNTVTPFSPCSLEISHIAKSFRRGRKKVLSDISCKADAGECIGILGANGCGKSTLLSILAGIQPPDSGFATLNGQTILCGKKNAGHFLPIGYVPQESPLMEELTAQDNLKLWYCDSPLSLKHELSDGFLKMLGITEFLHVTVKHMSGGMKKRLSIGCAMAQNPKLLLLDEPGAALDLICKERIHVYLNHYKKKGNIILLTTHEEQEMNLCDKLYILKDGILNPLHYDGNIHTVIRHF